MGGGTHSSHLRAVASTIFRLCGNRFLDNYFSPLPDPWAWGMDASSHDGNRFLDNYFSPLPDPWAWGMDASSHDWNGRFSSAIGFPAPVHVFTNRPL
jgi:hypothetical protein